MAHYRLQLFIAGRTARSQRALDNLNEIMETTFPGRFELEVIDVLEHPQLAEEKKILATPDVIRELPPPIRQVIGDLSDREQVLLGLDLQRLEGSQPKDEG